MLGCSASLEKCEIKDSTTAFLTHKTHFMATLTVSGFKLSLYFSATAANSFWVLWARKRRSQASVLVTYETAISLPLDVVMLLMTWLDLYILSRNPNRRSKGIQAAGEDMIRIKYGVVSGLLSS